MKFNGLYKGFILIPVIIAVFLLGAVGVVTYTVVKQNKTSPLGALPTLSDVDNKFSLDPLPTSTPDITPTIKPTVKPTTKPKVTYKPTATPAANPTAPPQTQTPTPTPFPYSTAKPVLTVTGPYTIGESGPCFDLKSHHPYYYSQSADFKFDQNWASYRYTTLRADGGYHVGKVCWEKDPSRTGQQYVFKAKAYTDTTPERYYSDEVSITYTHP